MFLKTVQQTKRFFKILIGFTLLLGGVIMVFTPGPGWPAIFAGLAVLAAAEIIWAKRLLDRLKAQGSRILASVRPSASPKNSS